MLNLVMRFKCFNHMLKASPLHDTNWLQVFGYKIGNSVSKLNRLVAGSWKLCGQIQDFNNRLLTNFFGCYILLFFSSFLLACKTSFHIDRWMLSLPM